MTIEVAGAIVNTGKQVWDVIKENRPVRSGTTDYANALPGGVSFTALTGWNATPRVVRIRYRSKFVFVRADVTIACVWFHGGRLNGQGRFVNHAHTAIARSMVRPAQKVNISASVRDPMNFGTAGDPIAALPISVAASRQGVITSEDQAWQVVVRGDGRSSIRKL